MVSIFSRKCRPTFQLGRRGGGDFLKGHVIPLSFPLLIRLHASVYEYADVSELNKCIFFSFLLFNPLKSTSARLCHMTAKTDWRILCLYVYLFTSSSRRGLPRFGSVQFFAGVINPFAETMRYYFLPRSAMVQQQRKRDGKINERPKVPGFAPQRPKLGRPAIETFFTSRANKLA
jgi:hypothetical protein